MRATTLCRRLLGIERTVVESFSFEDRRAGETLVVRVRPFRKECRRCSVCERPAPGYDGAGRERYWRHLDAATMRVELVSTAPRVRCTQHGIRVAAVPWARANSRFTKDFEDTTAWLATHAPASAVAELLRTTWRSVNGVIQRVVASAGRGRDLLDGLARIGIDEVAYRKGHRYLTVVVDHDTGRLVWARPGRSKDTLEQFFTELGERRAKLLEVVSADAADWIDSVVAEKAPQAVSCMDPFHVTQWATGAVDEVRRSMVSELKRDGRKDAAEALKGSRWSLLKNPGDLTSHQRDTLQGIKEANDPLYTAYLLKEQLREVFAQRGASGRTLLSGWISWAADSGLPAFEKVARTIRKILPKIHNTLDLGITNARAEANNTTLRMLTRRGYGYHGPDALIAIVMLKRSGLCPPLPGRT